MENYKDIYPNIMNNKTYLSLINVPRHGTTNTLSHSIRVANAAEKLAPKLGVDKNSAVKVGLLHDFCLVNYYIKDLTIHDGRWYCFYHPEDAVENSLKEGFTLTDKEQQAILSHMFPLATHIPKSRLALVLTLADKYVATKEIYESIKIKFFKKERIKTL